MKKVLGTFFILIGLFSLVGCGNDSSSEGAGDKGKIKLTLATNQGNANSMQVALEEIAEEYNKDNDKVEVSVQALADYEPTMKTRMAANDLPDLFFTHGWSTVRYNEYLEPLQGEKWISNINPLIKDRITDKEENIYVLPMDVAVSGIVFNEEILKEVEIKPSDLKTWEDFEKACEVIKEKGYTPIGVGGLQDSWTVANFIDFITPSFLITNEAKNYREELLDGTFDWKEFGPVYDMFMDYYDKGYFNSNVREGMNEDTKEGLANNEIAFTFSQSTIVQETQLMNEDIKLGILPFMADSKDDEATFVAGESCAIGVWKDGEHKEEAMAFLDYLSSPEAVNKLSAATTSPTGLIGDGYKADAGNLDSYYSEMESFRTFGYFDRDYLPSGMWDTITKAGEGMITKSGSKEEIISKIQDDYDKLISQ